MSDRDPFQIGAVRFGAGGPVRLTEEELSRAVKGMVVAPEPAPPAADATTFVVIGTTKKGRDEVIYAGQYASFAEECMLYAAKTGRFERFNFQRWLGGDRDSDDYNGDGSPMI